MANRVVETLSRLFYTPEAWGVAPEGGNPCRFVKEYQDRSCERFLSEQEFRRRGAGHRRLNAAVFVLATIDQELTKTKAELTASRARGIRLHRDRVRRSRKRTRSTVGLCGKGST